MIFPVIFLIFLDFMMRIHQNDKVGPGYGSSTLVKYIGKRLSLIIQNVKVLSRCIPRKLVVAELEPLRPPCGSGLNFQ